MITAKFTAAEANPCWWPKVLDVLARDYPAINDEVWSTAIDENAAEQVAKYGQVPLADVPMVCTACRKPVHEGPAGVWSHGSDQDWEACPARGREAKAMVAAGSENVPPLYPLNGDTR